MKKEIHIWDLQKMKANIAVDIDDSLKNEISCKIRKDISKIANDLGIQTSRLFEYFIWKKSFIPLKILFKISTRLKIPRKDIEKSIKIYKQLGVPSKNSIKNPKFPIKINPYFTSIVANIFFDGSMPKDGKGTYYNQKNKKIMDDFIKRMQYVFGDVSYSLMLDHRNVLKCRIPRLIGEICKYVYDVDSFGSFDSRVPKIIFSLNKNHKISFILTGILDEGSIAYDGSIQFGVSNKIMMGDFKELCNQLRLETTPIISGTFNRHHLYIKSIENFYEAYKEFIKKFPLFSLNYKEERIKKVLQIKKQKFFYTKIFAKKRMNKIMKELKHNERSINYLSSTFLIPPRTIRRYMYRFIKEGKVSRKKISNEYVYHLN